MARYACIPRVFFTFHAPRITRVYHTSTRAHAHSTLVVARDTINLRRAHHAATYNRCAHVAHFRHHLPHTYATYRTPARCCTHHTTFHNHSLPPYITPHSTLLEGRHIWHIFHSHFAITLPTTCIIIPNLVARTCCRCTHLYHTSCITPRYYLLHIQEEEERRKHLHAPSPLSGGEGKGEREKAFCSLMHERRRKEGGRRR